MLHEINKVNQSMPELWRRWFCDDNFDLFVWQNRQGEIVRFELSYAKAGPEHSIVWDKYKGYAHHRVDDGESQSGRYKMTPILLSDGVFQAQSVAEQFKRAGQQIDPAVAQFVHYHLLHYSKN